MREMLAVLLVVLFASAASAQGPAAVLEGVVTDTSGGVVVGATVVVREADTGQARTTVTDDSGIFRVVRLPVGTYGVRVSSPGFADSVRDGITLTIGQTVHLTIGLAPAGVVQSVAVSAQAPAVIDTRQTAVTTTVDTERIEELPVQSRNYLNFVLLAPGVVSSQPGTPSGSASVLPDSGFSFAGLRPRSNSLTIDGLDNNDRYTGGSRTELSLEIVREFQVVNNGWSAENGGASGGAVNVVTKSGVNTIHGDAFLFGESGKLNARPPLENAREKPSLARYRAGFAFGGPLVKDRTFYYGAVEREHMDGQAASDLEPATVDAINQVLASGRFPHLATERLTSGLFPIAASETEWSGKINHQVGARHSLMARVAGTRRDESGDAFNTGGLVDASARGSAKTDDTAVTASWTAIIGDTMTNELRGQRSTRSAALSTTDTHGPGVIISGIAEFGRPYAGNNSHDQRYAEGSDTFAWGRGRHLVKAGFDFANLVLDGARTDGTGGLYLFRSLDAFSQGQANQFRQVFGQSAVEWTANRAGGFVQEHWTPATHFTLDAGIRFDVESVPSVLAITNRQWSPRLGFAWLPASKWLVRGGAGLFADRNVLAALEPVLLVNGPSAYEQVASGATAAATFLANGGGPASVPVVGIAPSVYTVRPGQWQPSSRQASIGIEREITPNLSASVNYLFVRGHQLTRTVNVNLLPPVVLTPANAAALGIDDPAPQQIGRPVFGPRRVDAAFNDVFQLQPTASSAYHGITVALNRRLADEIEWSAAYTWSHATDNASDFDEQPQNPYDLAAETANSRYDVRHRFVASALVDLPIGDEGDQSAGGFWVKVFRSIEVAPILSIESGRPINPLTGADDARTDAYPLTARPLGSARNGLRLPASATLDLRILKFFPIKPHGRLDLVAEAFNVFNRVNVTALNAVYGPSLTPIGTFGSALDAATARRLQFSIDFEF